MRYLSTRDEKISVSPSEAIIMGLAPDGGLFVPDDLDKIRVDYKKIIKKSYKGMAREIFAKFFPDLIMEIPDIVNKSYDNKFISKEITPLKGNDDIFFLELFHGPTCAFKDVALSALPNLMKSAAKKIGFKDKILILTATSGDTGSAAMKGFSDVSGTGIIVFYPREGISDIQKLQMITQEAGNVRACAIRDNFDAAQRGVKKILSEEKNIACGISLSSANSINIGRLVPQIVYYFSAYKQLVKTGKIKIGTKISFTVPTGNFGNIMAGWFAREMGLPIGRLICASNKNNVLTDFLLSGHYDRKREFYKTSSPSMDILVSSNLERLLYFTAGSEKTSEYMRELETKGEYRISMEELEKIKQIFYGCYAKDDEASLAIRDSFYSNNYLIDTHTAVAYAGYKKMLDEGKEPRIPNVILATASPFKFPKAVLTAIYDKKEGSFNGEEGAFTPYNKKENKFTDYKIDYKKENELKDEDCVKYLSKLTKIEPPSQLAGVFTKKIKNDDLIDKNEMKDYIREKLQDVIGDEYE